MNKNTERALSVLKEENLTLVLCSKEETLKSEKRGVAALLELFGKGKDLSAFCAADRVVGKGAAVLFSALGVKEVYASVMSRDAQEILGENGISFFCGETADCILNQQKTDLCPIEKAVGEERNIKNALERIQRKALELSGRA